jgi:hypothetical protein
MMQQVTLSVRGMQIKLQHSLPAWSVKFDFTTKNNIMGLSIAIGYDTVTEHFEGLETLSPFESLEIQFTCTLTMLNLVSYKF